MSNSEPLAVPAAMPGAGLSAEEVSPWPFWALALAGAGYLAAALGQGLFGGLPGLAGLIMMLLPHQVLMLAGVVFGAMACPGELITRLGLQLPRGRDLALGAGAALLLFPLLLVIAQVAILLLSWFGQVAEESALLQLVQNADLGEALVLVLAATVLAPVVEELVFRRVLYTCLRRCCDLPLAMTLTAAVFAVFHLNLAQWVPLFVLGLALQIAVQLSKSLWPAIMMHAVHNGLAIAIFFLVKALTA